MVQRCLADLVLVRVKLRSGCSVIYVSRHSSHAAAEMPHDVLYSKPPPLAQAPLSNRSSHSQIMSSLTESENLRGPSGETDEGKPPLQSLPISPVHRVSLETLSNIFLLVKGSYEWSGREDWEWLVVTHVCRTWRQVSRNGLVCNMYG